MMNFMRDGGFNMWLILAAAIATVVIAFLKPAKERAGVFAIGAVILIGLGMFGMALGMKAVSNNFARFPDHAEAIGIGLGELSNNGSFGGLLATVFGIAALITKRLAKAAS